MGKTQNEAKLAVEGIEKALVGFAYFVTGGDIDGGHGVVSFAGGRHAPAMRRQMLYSWSLQKKGYGANSYSSLE